MTKNFFLQRKKNFFEWLLSKNGISLFTF